MGLEYSSRLLDYTELEWDRCEEKMWRVSIDCVNFLFCQVRYFFLMVQISHLTFLTNDIHCSKDKVANI